MPSNLYRSLLLISLLILSILVFLQLSDTSDAGEPLRLVWTSGDPELIPFELEQTDRIAVHAWLDMDRQPTAEALQVIAGQWQIHEEMTAFDAYDAADVEGLDASGFLGAVFDGRYVYFVPQHNREGRHGKVLRYDTHQGFHNSESWSAYDAGNTNGLETKGYYGGVFDGRYVYFSPRFDGEELHTRVLRYDTMGHFHDEESWRAFDPGHGTSYQGAGFDGQYIYFAPGSSTEGVSGLMLRYDTQSPFQQAGSWQTYDLGNQVSDLDARDYDGIAFDGQWIYYVPLSSSVAVRFDTRRGFDEPGAWQVFDAGPSGMEMCVGAVFDGDYLYYVPYDHDTILRYDLSGPFEDDQSWSSYQVRQTDGLTAWGYDGAFYDGRHLFFIPFFYTDEEQRMNFHGEILRYDTSRPFSDPDSWFSRDQSLTVGIHTVGYNAGVFDGRHFYFAPWHDGRAYHDEGRIIGHSRVLRYDSLEQGAFLLRYSDYGHNGGLSGALPGPSFTINTVAGPRTVLSGHPLPEGEVKISGIYDGVNLTLYIDDEPVASQPASGELTDLDQPLSVGQLQGGGAALRGRVIRLEIEQ